MAVTGWEKLTGKGQEGLLWGDGNVPNIQLSTGEPVHFTTCKLHLNWKHKGWKAAIPHLGFYAADTLSQVENCICKVISGSIVCHHKRLETT